MATINGIPMGAARVRGEMCNATDYTQAIFSAWVLEDGSWLDRVRPVTITLTLMPGYGSESHLFDRTAARIADVVEGRLFASAAAARKAVRAVRTRESLQYRVEVEEGNYHVAVPAELEAQAEAIREAQAAKDAAKSMRQRRKDAANLGVFHGADGQYRVTTRQAHASAHWVDGVQGRYWYCEGLDGRSDLNSVGICGPNGGYASASEAEAALATLQAHYVV